MTDDTEPDIDDSTWFRNFYIRNGYKDVEKWVRRACEASNAKYVPPVTRYEQEPAEFWELWECDVPYRGWPVKGVRGMIYRWATESDIPGIIALLDAEVKGVDWFAPAGLIRKLVTGENTDGHPRTPAKVMLAIEREVIGIGVMGLRGQLWNMHVRSDYRRQGIGRELLKRLNPRSVRCKTNMTSGNPEDFYRKAGYKPICCSKKRPHIKIMWRPAIEGEQVSLDDL